MEGDVREIVKAAVEELLKSEVEGLKQRVNELTTAKEEAERSSSIRAELQRLGVSKIDLAYKAVRDDVKSMAPGDQEMREYLSRFVAENPELLPARMTGGSGATSGQRGTAPAAVEIEKIRPGMSAEELDRVRQEIARALKG